MKSCPKCNKTLNLVTLVPGLIKVAGNPGSFLLFSMLQIFKFAPTTTANIFRDAEAAADEEEEEADVTPSCHILTSLMPPLSSLLLLYSSSSPAIHIQRSEMCLSTMPYNKTWIWKKRQFLIKPVAANFQDFMIEGA